MSSSLEDYLRVAWHDHAARPEAVVESFAEALAMLDEQNEAKFPDLARLIEHTLLGHLGVVCQLDPWLKALQAHAPRLPAARAALQRMAFANEVSYGVAATPPTIPDDQQLSGCANGIVAHCISGDGSASLPWLVQYTQELAHTTRTRAKAIAGAMNSLSFHLSLFKPQGVAREVMVAAALLGRDATARLGVWRDSARAEHFLALTHVLAGDGRQALVHAERCQRLCEQHRAPATELAMVEDARARAALSLGDIQMFEAARSRLDSLQGSVHDAPSQAQLRTRLVELDALHRAATPTLTLTPV